MVMVFNCLYHFGHGIHVNEGYQWFFFIDECGKQRIIVDR